MAGLIKKRRVYYIQFVNSQNTPTRKLISLSTTRKAEARGKFVKLDRAHREDLFDPWIDDPSVILNGRTSRAVYLDEASSNFLEQKVRNNRSPNTIRTYREVLSLFMKHLASNPGLSGITCSQVESFVLDPGLSKATQFKRFGHLRTFFRFCVRERIIRKNPLEQMEAPDKPHKLPKAITLDELDLICDYLRHDYHSKLQKREIAEGEIVWKIPAYRLAFFTGMRASEIARLRWKHIDLEKSLIYIFEQKNRREQTIPLNRKAREGLAAVPQREGENYVFEAPGNCVLNRNARWVAERLSKTFREARQAAGIERAVNFHSLRHGFCTLLAERGKQSAVIQAAARHADVNTTMRYIHLTQEYLKSELDDVFD